MIIGNTLFTRHSKAKAEYVCPLVSSMGSDCLHNCTSLSSITLSSLTTVAPSAFNGCNSLTDLVLPSTVQAIGNYSFANSALSSITFTSMPDLFPEEAFNFESSTQNRVINFPWTSGAMPGEPWGADTSKTTFVYSEEGGMALTEPDWSTLAFHLPLSADLNEAVSGRSYSFSYGNASQVSYTTISGHACADMPGNTKSSNVFGLVFAAAALNGVNTGNKSTSISMWFNSKADTTGGTYFTYLRYGQKTTNQALNLGGRHGRKIYAGNEGKDIGDAMGFNTSDIYNQTGKWYHQVVTYNKDTGNIIVYLNTEIIGNESVTLNITLGSAGLRIANTNRQCDSRYVHDIRIFNKCLTASEVQWLYENKC